MELAFLIWPLQELAPSIGAGFNRRDYDVPEKATKKFSVQDRQEK